MGLRLENVSFAYDNWGTKKRDVLNCINLHIGNSEIIGILGRSGSGKTTLIQHFNGLLKPARGTIYYQNKAYWSDEISMAVVRRKIGLAFQFPENQFFEEKVFDEISFGLKNIRLSEQKIRSQVQKIVALLSLDFEKWHTKNPYFLSTGEKRRVALASILVMEPEILVLDEPTAGLDISGINILKKIITYYKQNGKSVVIVTHNIDMLYELVDRIIILDQGKVVYDDEKNRLFSKKNYLDGWGLKMPRYVKYIERFSSEFSGFDKTNYSEAQLLMNLERAELNGEKITI